MTTKPQPNITTLSKLQELDERIKELYAMKRTLISTVVAKYGKGEYLYELDTPTEDGQKFVRYKLIDNLEAFESGEPMWKASAFERYGFELKYLKNQPKEKE